MIRAINSSIEKNAAIVAITFSPEFLKTSSIPLLDRRASITISTPSVTADRITPAAATNFSLSILSPLRKCNGIFFQHKNPRFVVLNENIIKQNVEILKINKNWREGAEHCGKTFCLWKERQRLIISSFATNSM